jgi:hypothetical protein
MDGADIVDAEGVEGLGDDIGSSEIVPGTVERNARRFIIIHFTRPPQSM